jgi:hypothetical protein
MRDADKPFVMYRRSRFNFSIVPRGVKGWGQFAIWMALLAPIMIIFARYAETLEGTPMFAVAIGLFVAATLVWSIAMIVWMKARAEVIDVTDMLRQKRQNDRRPRR